MASKDLDDLQELELAETSLEELERRAREQRQGRPLPLREWVALAERWCIERALREARGNRSAAAAALGIGRRTLYTKMERLGLARRWSARRRAREDAQPIDMPAI